MCGDNDLLCPCSGRITSTASRAMSLSEMFPGSHCVVGERNRALTLAFCSTRQQLGNPRTKQGGNHGIWRQALGCISASAVETRKQAERRRASWARDCTAQMCPLQSDTSAGGSLTVHNSGPQAVLPCREVALPVMRMLASLAS